MLQLTPGKNNTARVDVHRTDGKVADLIDEEALRASLGIDEKSTMVRAEPTTFFFDGTTLVLFVNVYTKTKIQPKKVLAQSALAYGKLDAFPFKAHARSKDKVKDWSLAPTATLSMASSVLLYVSNGNYTTVAKVDSVKDLQNAAPKVEYFAGVGKNNTNKATWSKDMKNAEPIGVGNCAVHSIFNNYALCITPPSGKSKSDMKNQVKLYSLEDPWNAVGRGAVLQTSKAGAPFVSVTFHPEAIPQSVTNPKYAYFSIQSDTIDQFTSFYKLETK